MNQDPLNSTDKIGRTDEPLVSIIVMTYNSSKYVLQTLDSAREQTYGNLELIVTDDCSPDNTVELVNEWMSRNKSHFIRCELITTQVNKGIPANCNRGVKSSEGEWVKIIAGDDILLETCIETFIKEIKIHHDLRFIASDMLYINEAGELTENKDYRYNSLRGYFFSLEAEKQLKLYARVPMFINSPSFFMHKETIKSVNYFDEEFAIYDDMPLIFNLLKKGIRISYLDRKTVKYRIYENSLSRTTNTRTSSVRISEKIGCFNKYRKKYLKKSSLIDLTVMYDFWLDNSYKGVFGIKGLPLLYSINFYQKYLNYIIKNYKKSDSSSSSVNQTLQN